jgi:hypothetical protein
MPPYVPASERGGGLAVGAKHGPRDRRFAGAAKIETEAVNPAAI